LQISLPIAFELSLPKFYAALGHSGQLAGQFSMSVPEATVNENDFSKPRKDEVRLSRQRLNVKSISEAHRVNNSSDNFLGPGIRRLYQSHSLAPILTA
jgi:hypothetical protein